MTLLPAVFVMALVVSAVLTRLVRDFSNTQGWNVIPDAERHIHRRRIPRLGGVAIFLTLWAATLLIEAAERFGVSVVMIPHLSVRILGPATLIFAVGVIDDFVGLGAYAKFVAQAGAAVLLFNNGFGITGISIFSNHLRFGWLIGLPLTVLWVVWITNAFNLIDGLDGLAAGCALFATLATCVAAICFHNEEIPFLSIALAGAVAGFLRYNFNPASIFLGDCGSLLIGFLLSAMALAGSQKAPTMAAVGIPLVSLGLPILDVTVAIVRRFVSCRGLFRADREHIHHKLLGLGASHKNAVLTLYGVSACFGLLSLFLLHPEGAIVLGVLLIIALGVVAGIRELGYLEFLELGRVASHALKQRRVIANDLTIWRAADCLRTCSSVPDFCRLMQECLKPAGIDGFGLFLAGNLPRKPAIYPLKEHGGAKLRFFWNRSMRLSDFNWSMSIGLTGSKGERLGSLTLYRKNASAALLVDPQVFSETAFAASVAKAVESMQYAWFAATSPARDQKPGAGPNAPLVATPVNRAVEAPAAG